MINSNINGDISLSKINEDISNESIWSSNDNKKINESITLNSECYENKKTEQLKYSEDTREVSGSHEKCMDNSQDNSKIFRKASFFDFVSRSEEDIFKLESPLYELRRKTVITKTTDPRRISIFSKQTTRHSYVKGKKVHDPSKKYKDGCPTRLGKRALMKVHIADIMEIKSHKGLFLNIIQIINTIIRFTIIQFPLCFRVLGLAFGPLIVCMIAIMSVFSVYMLLKVKEYTRESSFSAFAYKWWGMKGKILIIVLIILSAFGSCLSYIIIFLKIAPNLIATSLRTKFISDKVILSIILGLWLLFYCSRKDVSGIKAAAAWGVVSIFSFLVLNIVDLFQSMWNETFPLDKTINFFNLYSSNWEEIFNTICGIVLSFNFHTFTFSIYSSLENPNEKKMLVTTSIGVLFSTLIYLTIGTIGYVIYGNKVKDSLLDSIVDYTGKDYLGSLENTCFVLNVLMSFPITFLSLKHFFCFLIQLLCTMCRDARLQNKPKRRETEIQTSLVIKGNALEKTDKGSSQVRSLIVINEYVEFTLVVMLFVLIFYTAINYPNVKYIFSLLGATTANIFSFILPALMYVKFSNERVFSLKNIVPFFFIVIGIGSLFVCIASNIITLTRE